MSRAGGTPGGLAAPYARYRRSGLAAPLQRSSAIEAALGDLERALCRDRCHAVVDTAPGSAKALLLRALGERLAGSYHVVHLPSGLREDEVCARILGALGESPGRDAEVRLLSVLYEIGSRSSALVLVADDAGSLPEATLRRLGRLAAVARPDLRLALFVTPRAGADAIPRVIGALGVGAEKVVLQPRLEKRALARPLPPPEPATPDRASPPERGREERLLEEKVLDGIHLERRRSAPQGGALGWAAGLALLAGAAFLAGLELPAPAVREGAPPSPAADVAARGMAPASAVAEPAAQELPPAPEPTPEPEPASVTLPQPAEPPRVPERTARTQEPTPAAEPDPALILVSLNARPWARIEVDGREVGVTPLANLPLAPGLHRFRAHLADGRVIERTAHIDAYRDHVVFP